MSHNEYRDQMTYDATKEEETICEDCGVKNDESFSYYMNRCSDCCYKRDERNREYDKEKAEEEEFICDQKEKCSNDLSCIGCYPQEEKSKVVFEMGGEPIKELKMPYTMKDVMIAEGWKFVDDGDGDGITGGRGGFPLSYGGGGV